MAFLPPEALALICTYDMDNLRNYMGVCASWYIKIREGFDAYFKDIENEFIKHNCEYLMFL